MKKSKLIVVVGPTASGKTKLSVEIAKSLNGEIVSADSMQIYKNMQIATAKPTAEEMQGIKHHLIDFLDINKTYSVGEYVVDAHNAISDIISKGKQPILCGGTGLYVDSLIKGMTFEENTQNDDLRNELNKEDVLNLLNTLSEFDPITAEKLSYEKNKKRIIRAIEFYKTTGKPISQQNFDNQNCESDYECVIIGLTATYRQILYDRINLRVDLMVKDGLLNEAKDIFDMNLSQTSKKAIGYKELEPYFKNEQTLDYCIDRLKTETRRYAKRQLTWFRRNENINWVNIDEFDNFDDLFNYVYNLIKIKGFING